MIYHLFYVYTSRLFSTFTQIAILLLSNLEHNMSILIYFTDKIIAYFNFSITFRCDGTDHKKDTKNIRSYC